MWNPTDILIPCLPNLRIDLLPARITLQPLLRLRLVKPGLRSRSQQNTAIRDVPPLLELRGKERLHDLRLHLRRLGLAQLDQPVGIARVTRLAAEVEVDTDRGADGRETLEDGLCALGPEFLRVPDGLFDADLGRVRV